MSSEPSGTPHLSRLHAVRLVAHELRTPLTAITGYVALLLEDDASQLAAHQREYLGMVQRNAERLVNLIDDLPDIARLEAGTIALRRPARAHEKPQLLLLPWSGGAVRHV